MVSVCVLSAAWRRFDVTRLVLEQRRRLCVELAARGVDATSLVVADDENLEIAAELGCETLEAPNQPLGAKCNQGFRRAAEIADYVCWVGSDDWIHPDVFDPLPELAAAGIPVIVSGRHLQVVDLTRGRMRTIVSPSQYGAIPWLLDSRLLRTTKPALRPDLQRGLDGGLVRGLRLTRIPFEFRFHDPHPFRCVDFKTSENLTAYEGLVQNIGVGPETRSPWAALARWYPTDLVDQARALAPASRVDVERSTPMPKLLNPETGETVYATVAGAKMLRARGYVDVTEPPAASTDPAGWPDTHAAMDKLAEGLSFAWPPPPAGKKKLTITEKAGALEEAGHKPPTSE